MSSWWRRQLAARLGQGEKAAWSLCHPERSKGPFVFLEAPALPKTQYTSLTNRWVDILGRL